jgi:FlaG/FlaF family flagellin (archaellin)
MSASYYRMAALTGGTDDALDSVAGDALSDGDLARVITAAGEYRYILDADSAAAENSPLIISPDTNAGDKRWVLQQFIPVVVVGDAYKILRAKSDGSGMELVAPVVPVSVSVAGAANVNLTAAQAATQIITLTGILTGNIDVTVPAAAGAWIVRNATTGDYAITFKPLGGTGVVLDNGERSVIVCHSDGSTMRELTRGRWVSGTFDIDVSTTGSQAVTGLGGRPVFVDFIAAENNTENASWGHSDGTNHRCLTQKANGQMTYSTGACIRYFDASAYTHSCVIASLDAAGFTLTKSKTDTPSGTFTVQFRAFIL